MAFIGFLLLILPSTLATDDFDPGTAGNSESQDTDGTEPRLVRRNFLRFGKRSDPEAGAWMKRESENGPGEIYESTVVGLHPHRSSPRSFLRFGKRSGFSRPDSVITMHRDDLVDDDADANDIPFSAEELEEMLKMKRADNFLRFGKRYLPKDLRERMALLGVSDDGLNKRSKDFLRFG
jgi:hypothetical protein